MKKLFNEFKKKISYQKMPKVLFTCSKGIEEEEF